MKIECYLENLTQYDNDELEKISNSRGYQRNAREAAKQIIIKRTDFEKHISTISDEDLKLLFNDENKRFCRYDFKLFLKEFEKRNLTAKIWFLKNKNIIEGPFTNTEIKKMVNREINYHETYIQRKDMKEWYPANWIKGLFKDDYIPPKIGNHLRVAGILIFISCGLWFLIAFLQINIEGGFVMAIFNFIGAAIWLGIGRGVLQRKEWAQRTGIAWATVTAFYNFIIAIADSFNIFIRVFTSCHMTRSVIITCF